MENTNHARPANTWWDAYLDSIQGKCPNDRLQAIGIWGGNGTKWACRGITDLTVEECAVIFNSDTRLLGPIPLTLAGHKFERLGWNANSSNSGIL